MFSPSQVMARSRVALALVVCCVSGCFGDDVTYESPGGTGGGSAASTSATTTTTATAGTGGGGGGAVADPAQEGPFAKSELVGTMTVTETGHDVPMHVVFPDGGPSPPPYPIVLFGHGFQLPVTQYYGYLGRLASHGFVAATVDFPASFVSVSHVDNAADVVAAIDWLAAELPGVADPTNVGATGHSLGGKVAVLAAARDARIGAVIALDPVDGSMGCNATACPDASALLPLPIPTAWLGETLDGEGGFQPCAPAEHNFQTFHERAGPPSLLVDVLGAGHMSFLDDLGACGFTCSFCNAPTAPNEQVTALARAMLVAFFRRHLAGETAYETYLFGAEAEERYVQTGQATLESK